MSSYTSHMSITEFEDTGAVVRLTVNKIDEHEAGLLISEFGAFVKNNERNRIAMDYTEVDFVASAGLGAMITMYRAVNEAGGKCVVTGLNENVMGVLKLTKLDKLFTIEKTLAKAQKRLLK
ncbi:MAG: STAS domain-containing protein [Phycisphaerales bacterium]